MGLLDRVRERGGATSTGSVAPKNAAAAASSKVAARPQPASKPSNSSRPVETKRSAPSMPVSAAARAEAQTSRASAQSEHTKELKVRIHSELIDRLDLAAIGSLGPVEAGEEIRTVIGRLLEQQELPLSNDDRRRLEAEITSEVLGFGPLDPLLKDDTVSDILVNSARQVYVERRGKLQLADIHFRDDEHLIQIIDRIVSQVGRRVDASSPMVDARLPDGSRVNAIIPPIALDGPALSIRRFGKDPFHIHDLVSFASMSEEMARFFDAIVRARQNICLLYTSPSPRDATLSRMPSSA